MHLALLLRPGGYHRAAWRYPGNRIEEATNLEYYVEMALAAEAAHLDALFIADSLVLAGDAWDDLAQPIEPLTLLSALAARTSHIGLIGTISTSFTEPYNVARQLSSLDHLSNGRAGWNVVTTADERSARNFGSESHLQHGLRYRRADEFVEVSKKLWSSWQDDAIVIDRVRGVQTDRSRITPIDHVGEFFSVQGPLNLPRSPQGWPVLAHAGQSSDGLPVAARHAEVLFGVQHDIEDARASYSDLKARVVAMGRQADDLKILPGLMPIIGGTEAEARATEQELRNLGGQATLAKDLSRFLGIDLEAMSADTPIEVSAIRRPEAINGPQSWYGQVYAHLQRKRTTVGQLLEEQGRIGRSGHLSAVGTPEQVADLIENWVSTGASDGFTIIPTTVPQSASAFLDQVVPLLVKRGIFRQQYEATTLRGHLSLPVPC